MADLTGLKGYACANCGAGDGANLSYEHDDPRGVIVCCYCGHRHGRSRAEEPLAGIRDDIRLKTYAEKMGYTVDCKRDQSIMVDGHLPSYTSDDGQKRGLHCIGDAWSFQKGSKHIWACAEGWVCADLVDHHFRGHRYYHFLREALDWENKVDAGTAKMVVEEKLIFYLDETPLVADAELKVERTIQQENGEQAELLTADPRCFIRFSNGDVHDVLGVAKRRAFLYGRNL